MPHSPAIPGGHGALLTFALAAGRAIPESVLAALDDPQPAELPFRASEHICWSNPAGTVIFAGWQDDVDLGVGSRWCESPAGLTAFTGHVWPRANLWSGNEPWSTQLARFLRANPLRDGTRKLLGIFTAISLDNDGRGTIAPDGLSTSLLYRSAVRGTTILSSRAKLAARLASDGPPARDVLGTGWLAYSGYPIGTRTGFEGVDVVPFGVRAEISPTGVTYRQVTPPWAAAVSGDPRSLLDDLHSDIATSIRAALAYPVSNRIMELTGGKDSRVVLAVLLAEGLADQFEYRTLGSKNLADVDIASDLATRFGLSHEAGRDHGLARRSAARGKRLAARFPDDTWRERALRLNVGLTSGMRLAWQVPSAAPPTGDRVTLGGNCGEALTTNYPQTTALRNHAELHHVLVATWGHGTAKLLRRDALEHYRAEAVAAAYDGFGSVDAPQDLIDAMYIRHRLRRWFGATQEVDERNHVFPLHSQRGVELAFAIGARDRHRLWTYRELFERTIPSLADQTFASWGWPDQSVPARRRDTTSQQLRRVLAARVSNSRLRQRFVQPTPPATVGQESRENNATLDREIMRRYLLDDPSNRVFEIVDRRAVETAINDFPRMRKNSKDQLCGAMSAAIWLGGHEIDQVP